MREFFGFSVSISPETRMSGKIYLLTLVTVGDTVLTENVASLKIFTNKGNAMRWHQPIYTIRTTLVRAVVVCLAGILLCPPTAVSLTITEEKELGQEFFRQARQSYRFIDDPFINHYINRLGNKLVKAVPNPLFDYTFFVIQEDTYNAFAAPGGYIFVNSGLIAAMETEDELAGILAHEIAHVNCRHISEKLEKNKKISIATLAGIAASIFLGAATGIPGSAIAIGSAAAGQSAMLAYSREDERQADQLGLTYLYQAGYSPKGLLVVLKKIKAKEWYDSNDVPTYLTTHPAVNERITYLGTLMASTEPDNNSTAQSRQPTGDFAVVLTKIIAEYSDETMAEKKFAARLEANPNDSLAQYGYGLVLARKARYTEAITHFQAALSQDAFNPNVLKDLGQAYCLAGQYENALRILKNIPPNDPDNDFYDPVHQFYLAKTVGAMGKTVECIDLLNELIQKRPDFTPALYQLGKTYGEQGQMEDAHFYLGLYYKDRHEHENALFHLQKARELATDSKRKQDIEKILDEVRATKKKFER